MSIAIASLLSIDIRISCVLLVLLVLLLANLNVQRQRSFLSGSSSKSSSPPAPQHPMYLCLVEDSKFSFYSVKFSHAFLSIFEDYDTIYDTETLIASAIASESESNSQQQPAKRQKREEQYPPAKPVDPIGKTVMYRLNVEMRLPRSSTASSSSSSSLPASFERVSYYNLNDREFNFAVSAHREVVIRMLDLIIQTVQKF